jgi:hypothetical protein
MCVKYAKPMNLVAELVVKAASVAKSYSLDCLGDATAVRAP